jgi:outer membrane protein OmpA-like peptidoglycan-associated protein
MKIFAFICLFSTYSIYAQSDNKLDRKAEKLFYAENFKGALIVYNEILDLDSKNNIALYHSELCSLLTDYSNKSVELLVSYEQKLIEKDRFYPYWLGRIHKKKGDFKAARKSWDIFLALDIYKSPLILLETQSLIEETKLVINHNSLPINYQIEKLDQSINSMYNEFSPTFIKSTNTLLFFRAKENNNKNYQLSQTQYNNGEWSMPIYISNLGSFNQNDTGIGLVETNEKTFIYSDLYYVLYENGNWSEKITTSEDSEESHIYMNSTESKIIFSAKTMGDLNNLDLFMVTLDEESKNWNQPQRFGNEINTLYDEDYPYLSEDENTLYFSSKGHGTMGGYDIYKSTFNQDSNLWSNAVNLNLPINSIKDEIHFKIDEKTNSGFLNSNRFGNENSHDIFLFHDIFNISIVGKVIDETGKPVPNAKISLFSLNYITKKIDVVSNEDGIFKTVVGNENQIKIEIKLNEKIIYTNQLDIKVKEESNILVVNKEFKVRLPKEVSTPSNNNKIPVYDDKEYSDLEELTNKFRLSKKALIGNLYFNFNESKLTKTSSKELNQLLNLLIKNNEMKVEIAGHTDNIGTDKNNLFISKKRSESVVSYLISKGINKNRLVTKFYGESKPIASNDDYRNGRELNRRIEVIVIE